MIVLGIETSCDETAVALVRDDRTVLSNQVLSQVQAHAPYGGVVPEIASRAHMDALDTLIVNAMQESGCGWSEIDGIAVTGGPGLIGGVIVGVMTAKALASVQQKPLIAVNHLEGHALTVRLTDDVAFPYLLLLVSGGHCQLVIVKGLGDYTVLGSTIDDALGEAFDKTAKLLGLDYPGGPAVEKAAKAGDVKRFRLPRPLLDRPGYDFSFSGLKTAVRKEVKDLITQQESLSDQDIADVSAAFQDAASDILQHKVQQAICQFVEEHGLEGPLVVAGGVAANQYLREKLESVAQKNQMTLIAPPPALCTDNAAMIAWAGLERLRTGQRDTLDFTPRARWALERL